MLFLLKSFLRGFGVSGLDSGKGYMNLLNHLFKKPTTLLTNTTFSNHFNLTATNLHTSKQIPQPMHFSSMIK